MEHQTWSPKAPKVYIDVATFQRDVRSLYEGLRVLKGTKLVFPYTHIYGVPRGGSIVAAMLSEMSGVPAITTLNSISLGDRILIVDDLIDSGATCERHAQHDFAAVYSKIFPGELASHIHVAVYVENKPWMVFFWEAASLTEDAGSIEDNVVRLLQYIGEDVKREGLLETPARVIKAYNEIFSGYKQDPAELVKTFTEGACDDVVVLRDIEFYSMCEHHMLPFFGKAHIAYIPDGKVIGVSKLARLLDIYARRLQIQERLGDDITGFLMKELGAKGAACVIEAQHLCMKSRGVRKQDSIMVTSSMMGAFRNDASARAEVLALFRG